MSNKWLTTDAFFSTFLIRIMVGAVFLSEGIQKFLFADKLGTGRFAKIGLPLPEILGPVVGAFEIVAGSLLLLGLATRLVAIVPLVIMLVAIATTKSAVLAEEGFWAMMHGSRTDWSMLLGSIFLMIRGAGGWSIDGRLQPRPRYT